MENKIFNCVAVDDEPFALEIIQNFCRQLSNIHLTCFNNSVEADKYLKIHTPDILFLDIVMPDISGLEIAKLIKNTPYIIFTTAHKDYALESYDYNTVDYLLKPYNFDRFYKSVEKAKQLLLKNNSANDLTITIMVDYHKVLIKQSDITHIESLGNYVKVYLKNKYYLTQMNLKSLLELLDSSCFKQVHRSFVVNYKAIESYTKSTIMIANHTIPIGRMYKLNIN